jgi:hypothetical protein
MVTDDTDHEDEPFRTLEYYIQLILELEPPFNVCMIQDIVRDAVHANLRAVEIAHLEEAIVDHTRLAPKTVAAMVREARNFHKDHGYLNTLRETALAYLSSLESEYSGAVWVGGSLFYYKAEVAEGDTENPETGFFQRATTDEVDGNLLESFEQLPLVQISSKRSEIVRQVKARLVDEEFFADARPGVNVANGFVGWDSANGLTLLPHDPGHKARMKLEARFDPNASYDWLAEMLARTLQDQSKLDALQEIAGAVIFNIRPQQDEARRLIVFAGPKNSGKSTMLTMLERLMPSSVVASVPPSEWGKEYYRARLEGLSLNIVTELGGEMRIAGKASAITPRLFRAKEWRV